MTYVHVRVGRDRAGPLSPDDGFVAAYDEGGVLVRNAREARGPLETGDLIGSVNRFNHVHLNVGWPGRKSMLSGFACCTSPTASRRAWRAGITLLDDTGQAIVRKGRGKVIVTGPATDRRRCVGSGRWQSSQSTSVAARPGLPGAAARWFSGGGLRAASRNHPDGSARPVRRAHLIYSGSGTPFLRGRRTGFLYRDEHDPQRDHIEWTSGSRTLPSGDYTVRRSPSISQATPRPPDLPVTVEHTAATQAVR